MPDNEYVWVLFCGALRRQKRKSYQKQELQHANQWGLHHANLWRRTPFETEEEGLRFMCNQAEVQVKTAMKRRETMERRLAEAMRGKL